jgi:hypothetical protein
MREQQGCKELSMKIACGGVFVLALCAGGCGETPIPTTPSGQSLFSQDSRGLWLGELSLLEVAGGECVGSDIAAGVGQGERVDEGTVSINQTASEVTATIRSSTTGSACTFTGTAGTSLFGLDATECDKKEVFFRCTNGSTRVLNVVDSTLNAFSRAGEMSGTVTTFYNVHMSDSQRTPVAGMSVRYRFEAVRP